MVVAIDISANLITASNNRESLGSIPRGGTTFEVYLAITPFKLNQPPSK